MTAFILALFSTRNKLRLSTLYQVLSGKRTSSVLIYGFLNDLLFVLGSFPKLTQAEFLKVMDQLVHKKWLILTDNQVMITALGKKELAKLELEFENLHYDRYGRTADTCWRLIKFAVQVVSNLARNISDYLPVETSPYYTVQVKRWLADSQFDRLALTKIINQELNDIFSAMPEEAANFLANQFSGANQTGLLSYQLTDISDEVQRSLYEAKSVHLLLQKIEATPNSLLYYLIQPLLAQNVNQSMLATRKLVLDGYSVDDVMKIRNLKKGTVTDHLIEWQLYFSDFPYERMISIKTRERLSQLPNARTWNYRELNEKKPLDYGEFRFYQIGVLKGEIMDETQG